LSEAFTRPKVMKALAKLSFSQSYTYTWRTSKQELQAYLSELTAIPTRVFPAQFFRQHAQHSASPSADR
jgi:starch synthase (maltosyl-transferring)